MDIVIDYKALGRRVKAARVSAGLTQEALAEMVGVSLPHISNIETGNTRVSLPTLIKLANALGVSLDPLLCDSVIQSAPAFLAEAKEILADCSAYETRVLVDVLKSTKAALRKHRPFQNEKTNYQPL